ncbi:GPCR, family 2, secretin-like [Fusarium oxysporum f. sp. vasinfectum]|nr:GPCR, family 2, secretin-like [Fusarium oxysporum f. sp. vasinfectum]
MTPTPSQAHALALVERIEGCMSLVAVFLIFITYGLVARLRNPRNTFIVMASIANLGSSIACIIARDGLAAGEDSALCKAQAFLLQMFGQSDPWWAFGLSLNTLLVVLGRTNPHTFHALQYCLVCFGGPFTIAFTLLFISTPARGPIYGQAYVWCSVSDNWPNVRVFSFIYLRMALYRWFGRPEYHCWLPHLPLKESNPASVEFNRLNEDCHAQRQNAAYPVLVAEDFVTLAPVPYVSLPVPLHTRPTLGVLEASIHETADYCLPTITSNKPRHSTPRKRRVHRTIMVTRRVLSKYRLEDPVKRVYLRATLLFTFSVVVSWTPATINRFHSFKYGYSSFPYQIGTVSLLPLQGVWNAIIFFVTSHKIMEDWAQDQRTLRVSRPRVATEEAMIRRPVRGPNMGLSMLD